MDVVVLENRDAKQLLFYKLKACMTLGMEIARDGSNGGAPVTPESIEPH